MPILKINTSLCETQFNEQLINRLTDLLATPMNKPRERSLKLK